MFIHSRYDSTPCAEVTSTPEHDGINWHSHCGFSVHAHTVARLTGYTTDPRICAT